MPIIRVVDTETTGMEPPAEVCEIGWADYDTELKTVRSPYSIVHRVESMPPEVRAIHHISLAESQAGLPFEADEFLHRSLTDGAIGFAAHNLKFEEQWLNFGDCWKICTYKVALRVWPQAPSHSNGALRYWLEDQGLIAPNHGQTMPPHRAGPDAYVTAHILQAAFAAGATGAQMVAWTKQPALLPTCPIGEHRGKPWAEVPHDFLIWMVDKAKDMDSERKWNAEMELARRRDG